MAGSGKRSPHSILRPPLTGPPIVTPPPNVRLAVRQLRPHRTSYFIGAPIVGPPVTTPAPKTKLVGRSRLIQRPVSAIRPPTVVDAAVTYPAAKRNLVALDRRRLHVSSQRGVPSLAPVQVVPPPAAPQVHLASRLKRPNQPHQIIGVALAGPPAPVYIPPAPQVHLASRPKRPNQTRPIVGVPIAGPPAPVYIPAAPQLRLVARSQKFRPTSHWVHTPIVVNPAVTFPAAHLYIARR